MRLAGDRASIAVIDKSLDDNMVHMIAFVCVAAVLSRPKATSFTILILVSMPLHIVYQVYILCM